MRSWSCILIAALGLSVGCASSAKRVAVAPPPPTSRPVVTESPVIDIARGGGGLPLDNANDMSSREALLAGLLKGFDARIALPTAIEPIVMVGADYRNLDQLRIDVTNGTVRGDYRPRQYKAPGKVEPSISVRRFEYRAAPLLYQNGATRWHIFADDARFGLLKDGVEHPTLILTDARQGSFDFSIRLADMKPMMVGGSAANSRGPFAVHDVDLTFTSDNPHMLAVDILVKASLLYVPTTFHAHARGDVDEWCNVRLSELSCDGVDASGKVVAGIIDNAMQKFNGKVKPLVRWPGDRVVLTDVQIKLDDALTISAKFQEDKTKASADAAPVASASNPPTSSK